MSWSNCPKCYGTGLWFDFGWGIPRDKETKCPVCEGKMIVNDLTGRPPEDIDVEKDKEI